MLKKNAWDYIENVLGWVVMVMFWGVVLPIVAVKFIFFGEWLSIAPGTTKEAKT